MKDVLRGMTWGVVALGLGFIVLTVIAPPQPRPVAIPAPAAPTPAAPASGDDGPQKQPPALSGAAAPDAAPGTLPAAPVAERSTAPETGTVELPAGSEFNRPPPEDAARLPETDTTTSPGAAPTVASPAREAAPTPDTMPSAMPDTGAGAPAAITPPAAGTASGAGGIGPADAPVATGPARAPATPDAEAEPRAPDAPPAPDESPEMAVAEDDDTRPVTVPAPDSAPDEGVTPAPPSPRQDGPAASEPSPPAATPPATAPSQPAPDPAGGPAPEDGGPDAAPQIPTDLPPGALRIPAPGGEIAKPDVRVGQLPTVGDGAEAGADAAASPAAPADLGALARHAVPFEPEGEKPLFSVILIEAAEGGLDRAALTTFSFPVTFAIDPGRADAAEAARSFRDAGFEVVALADDLPAAATPQDVEVNIAAWQRAVPPAVAVMDPAEGGFGTDRAPLRAMMGVLDETGHGVISFDSGLNTIDQLARAAGVPSALVFRSLDARRENAATIRRYLDRAAFKAARDGHVVMVGHSYPQTVTALYQWMLDGKGNEVTMAPISAILRQ